MVPLTHGADPSSWLTLLVILLLPGVVATVMWSPMLASERLRSLFRRLTPLDSTVGNYVITAMTLSVPWLVALGWTFQQVGSQAEPQGEVFLNTATLVAVIYVVALPLVAGVGLPRLGIDWDRTDYGPSTWLLLIVSSAWYAAIFTIPMFLMGLIISLPF